MIVKKVMIFAIAGLAALVLAAAVAAAVVRSGGPADDSVRQGGSGPPAEPAASNYGVGAGGDAVKGLAPSAEAIPPAEDGPQALSSTGLIDRKIIRNATVEITVDDVLAAVKKVEDAAQAAGGFVSSSTVNVQDLPRPAGWPPERPAPKRQTATVTVRVPAESFTSVMNQIRGIAKEVTSESSNASEVTEEYTDLQARLRNLQAIEQQYLQLLARAEAISDILTVQDRLNSVRAEIEQVQGRINLLDNLIDMATITVSISPPPLPEKAGTQPGWARQAWDDAWETSSEILRQIGVVAITAGVVLMWLGVPALILLGLGWRLWGGRRTRGEIVS